MLTCYFISREFLPKEELTLTTLCSLVSETPCVQNRYGDRIMAHLVTVSCVFQKDRLDISCIECSTNILSS